jgi:hypothetical protein
MTPHVDTPWIGLAALVAMFAIPFLPSWLFEGPRTIKHYPRWHVCGDCGAPWTDGHTCAVAFVEDRVAVRDSKHRGGPVLVFTADEWASFLRGVVDGEFELPR